MTSTWTRCAFGVLLVAGPAATEEVGGNLANLHWVLTLGAILAVWAPATGGRWRDFAGGAVCLAAGLSDPLAALAFIPLAGRFVLEFRRDDALPRTVASAIRVTTAGVALPVAMLATSLMVQAAVSLTSPRPMRGIPTAGGLVELVLSYWGPQALMGRVLAGGAALVLSVPVVFVGGVVAVLVVWVASIRILRGSNLLSLAIVSAVAVVVPLAMNWNPDLLDVRFPSGTGRYAFLPASLTALAALLLADQRLSRRGRKVGGLSAGVMLLGVLAGLAYPSFVSRGPEWRSAVDEARVDCPVGGSAPVPIAPDGWVVQVPCALM